MKNYFILVILFLFLTLNVQGQSQFIAIQISPQDSGNIVPCKQNTFNLTVTPSANLSGTLTMLIPLQPHEVITGANVIGTSNDTCTINLGNNLSASVHSYSFQSVIKCDGIEPASSPIQYTHPITININDTVYDSNNWQINNPGQHVWVYQWGFPLLQFAGAANMAVDYIDSYNNTADSLTRKITIVNNGTSSPLGTLFGGYRFSDSVSCSHVRFDSVYIYQNTQLKFFSNVNAGAFSTSILQCTIPKSDSLIIVEKLKFPNYEDSCLNDCSRREFFTKLEWGCDTTNGYNLCQIAEPGIRDQFAAGSNLPRLNLARALPNSGNGPNGTYWDTSATGDSVNWRFILTNTGSDVAKDVLIRIDNPVKNSLSYIDTSSVRVDVLGSNSYGTLISMTALTLLTNRFPSTPRPSCLLTYPAALSTIDYRVDKLFPNQQIEINLTTIYCCAENDDGTGGSLDLFAEPKTLNSWSIQVNAIDECGDPVGKDPAIPSGMFPVPATIGNNTAFPFEHLYLDQEYNPSVTDFDVPTPNGCSAMIPFVIQNTKFNLNKSNFSYLQNDANLLSGSYHPNPDSMFVQAIVRFQFELEPGLNLDTSFASFLFSNGIDTIANPVVNLIGGLDCDDFKIYTVDFNVNSLSSGNSLRSFYQFMNSSSLRFNFFGCCCYPSNTNPAYIIKTFLSGLDQSCFIPMNKKDGKTFIHCAGCTLPGIIVKGSSRVLERENLGWADNDNNGIMDLPQTRADSSIALRTNSFVGDTLVSRVNTEISPSVSQGCSITELRSLGINLDYLFLEARIQNSNTSRFDVRPLDVVLTIDSFQAVTISPSHSLWSLFYVDYRDSGQSNNPENILFFNLSLKVLDTLNVIAPNYKFHEGADIDLTIRYIISKNYYIANSLLPDDNRFRSEVNLNMYLTGVDLTTLGPNGNGIYNAYSAHVAGFPAATGCTNLDDSMLFVCETRNGYHTFYSIQHYHRFNLTNGGLYSNDHHDKCHKAFSIVSEKIVGGDLYNVFPFEYRQLPITLGYAVNLPGGNNNYIIEPARTRKTDVRAYNENNCFPYNRHSGNFTDTMIIDATGFVPIQLIQFDSSISALYNNPSVCNTGFSSVPGILSGDEYKYLNMEFLFRPGNCQFTPAAVDSATIVALDSYNGGLVDTVFIPTHIVSSDTMISPPFLAGYTSDLQTTTMNLTVSDNSFNYELKNPIVNMSTSHVEYPFILIPNPGNFSNILTITSNGITDTARVIQFTDSSNITSQAFFYEAPKINRGGSITYSIAFEVDSCEPDSMPLFIYHGWNCDTFPATDSIFAYTDFCYINLSDTLSIRLDSANVNPGLTPPKPKYALCKPQDFVSTLNVSGAAIHNLRFCLRFHAEDLLRFDTMNFNPLTDIYFDLEIDPNLPTIPIPYSIDSILTDGYCFYLGSQVPPLLQISSGNSIIVNFTYLPTLYSSSISSPFTVYFEYSNYCDNIVLYAPSTKDLKLTSWSLDSLNPSTCPYLSISASSAPVDICAGQSIQLSSIIQPIPPGDIIYHWTSSPPLSIDSVQNPVITNLQTTTTFTVTATDTSNRTGTAMVTVVVTPATQCCIPPTFDPQADFDFSNTDAITVTNTMLNGIPQINTTQIILINGTFTVNRDFEYQGCHNIILGPGAQIIVLPGFQLNLYDCVISSCNEMGRGIIADSASVVQIRGSTISDCQYAVQANPNSTVLAYNATLFDRNYVGIYTPPNAVPSNAFISIYKCEFNCTDTLKPGYYGQSPPPRTHSFAGIQINNLALLNISQANNRFVNLNFGIYSYNSNLSVSAITNDLPNFQRIQAYDRNLFAPNVNATYVNLIGAAIYARGDGSQQLQVTGNSLPANYLTSSLQFDSCRYGIICENMNSDISKVKMADCRTGIKIFNTNHLSTNIFANTIFANSIGIDILNNIYSFKLDIGHNRIFTNASSGYLAGIRANDFGIANYNAFIHHNSIFYGPTTGSQGSFGIDMNGTNGYVLKSNSIFSGNSASNMSAGISLQGCRFSSLNCNTINGGRTALTNNNNFAIMTKMSPHYFYKCNIIKNTFEGFHFEGMNASIYSNKSLLESNEIFEHKNSLHILPGGRMGEQNHKGTIWLGNPRSQFAWHRDSIGYLNDKFIYYTGLISHSPTTTIPASNWFLNNILQNDETCYNYQTATDFCAENSQPPSPQIDLMRMAETTQSNSQTSVYDEENSYSVKRQLLQEIILHPAVINEHNDIEDFYDNHIDANLGILSKVRLAIDSFFVTDVEWDQVNNLGGFYNSLSEYSSSFASNDSILLYDSTLSSESRLEIIQENVEIAEEMALISNSIGDIHEEVRDLLANRIAAITALLGSTSGENVMEDNEMASDEIFINTLLSGTLPDSADSTALFAIASQCPLTGGPAVFQARTLYQYIDPDAHFDDDRICASPDTCLVPERPEVFEYSNELNNMGLCGASLQVTTSSSVDQYYWNIPDDDQINVVYNNDDNTIELEFGYEFSKAELCVSAANACGMSPQRCVMVYGRPAPVLPENIQGEFNLCPWVPSEPDGPAEPLQGYSWDPIPGATSYTVISPSEDVAIIETEMPTSDPSVGINWNDSLNTDSIAIFASNDCGNSDTTYFKVTCQNLRKRSIPFNQDFNKNVKVFPNPTQGTVHVSYIIKGKGLLLLRNGLGQVLQQYKLEDTSTQYAFLVTDIPNGLVEWLVFDDAELIGKGLLSIMK